MGFKDTIRFLFLTALSLCILLFTLLTVNCSRITLRVNLRQHIQSSAAILTPDRSRNLKRHLDIHRHTTQLPQRTQHRPLSLILRSYSIAFRCPHAQRRVSINSNLFMAWPIWGQLRNVNQVYSRGVDFKSIGSKCTGSTTEERCTSLLNTPWALADLKGA